MWPTFLAIRRQRMMADYALKVKSVPNHPAASTVEDCWQSHYANYPVGREPFRVKVKKILEKSEIFPSSFCSTNHRSMDEVYLVS